MSHFEMSLCWQQGMCKASFPVCMFCQSTYEILFKNVETPLINEVKSVDVFSYVYVYDKYMERVNACNIFTYAFLKW